MSSKAEAQAMALVTKDNTLPAHLQGQVKSTKIGNVDRSDMIIPRVKLLQAVSPEIEAGVEGAKAGEFWHTTAGISLGAAVRVVPVILRKTYVLWAPRNDDRGILARATDGKRWDTPGLTFEVKPKWAPKGITYELGELVSETIGLGRFGTSNPEDPNSAPAASLNYEIMFLFPDHEDLGAALVLNTRSAVRAGKDLISKVDMRPADHYAQEYIMKSIKQKKDDQTFYNYQYVSNGYADEGIYDVAKTAFEYYNTNSGFSASDESDDTDTGDRKQTQEGRDAPIGGESSNAKGF